MTRVAAAAEHTGLARLHACLADAFEHAFDERLAPEIGHALARLARRSTNSAVARGAGTRSALAQQRRDEIGQHGDAVFMAMEFVEGQTLAAWLQLRGDLDDAVAGAR